LVMMAENGDFAAQLPADLAEVVVKLIRGVVQLLLWFCGHRMLTAISSARGLEGSPLSVLQNAECSISAFGTVGGRLTKPLIVASEGL